MSRRDLLDVTHSRERRRACLRRAPGRRQSALAERQSARGTRSSARGGVDDSPGARGAQRCRRATIASQRGHSHRQSSPRSMATANAQTGCPAEVSVPASTEPGRRPQLKAVVANRRRRGRVMPMRPRPSALTAPRSALGTIDRGDRIDVERIAGDPQHRFGHHAHGSSSASASVPTRVPHVAHFEQERLLDEDCGLPSSACARPRRLWSHRSLTAAGLRSPSTHRRRLASPVRPSRDRASAAHGETLSRFRYSVHAVFARRQRQRRRRERAVEPRFFQRRIEPARAIGRRERARQVVRTQAEPRAFELHGGDVAQILGVGRLLARGRQQRLRRVVVAPRQKL